MKKLIIVFSLISFLSQSQNTVFQWAKSMGATGADEGNAVAVDATGNVYTVGTFAGTVDFDPGPTSFTLASAGAADVFVSKLDGFGNFLWAKKIGGTSNEAGKSIKLDASGNIFLTGFFSGSVDFDPGVGSFVMASAGNTDVFICKLDGNGNFIWAKKHGSTLSDSGLDISVDATGNVYTTGYFVGTVDFDPGAGSYTLTTASSNTDIFISKLDATGNFVWAISFGDNGAETGRSIYVDASNVYLNGEFQGTVDFDPGVGVTNIVANGAYDVCVLKLNQAGSLVWAKALGSAGYDIGNGIFADANNIYVTGSFEQNADFDPGVSTYTLTSAGLGDIFIEKLDASGNFVWVGAIGNVNADEGRAIEVDATGNIHTTGIFEGTMDFDPNLGTLNLTSMGQSDVFIHKMSPCIFPVPPANTTNAVNQTICSGNTTTLNASGSGTLSWYSSTTSTVALITGTTFVTPVLTTGTYTYYVEAETCTISASRTPIIVTVNLCTGINKNTHENLFSIYPNPCTDNITIEVESLSNLQVIDVLGKIVLETKLQNLNNTINISHLRSGVYYFKIKQGDASAIKKLIKQ